MADGLAALLDKDQIRDCLMRYSHGIDRCDAAMLRTVYWPDAVDNHGTYNGNAYGFIEYVIPLLKSMAQTQHTLGNILIELEGDHAWAETYVTAYHHIREQGGTFRDSVVGGRYLDRFEKRGGTWRIAHRIFVLDWNQNVPGTAQWEGALFGALRNVGTRHPDDAYDRFKNGTLR